MDLLKDDSVDKNFLIERIDQHFLMTPVKSLICMTIFSLIESHKVYMS